MARKSAAKKEVKPVVVPVAQTAVLLDNDVAEKLVLIASFNLTTPSAVLRTMFVQQVRKPGAKIGG